MKAISEITKRCTGEFAVRVFITTYPDRALRIMKKWARSKNFHLRRLASEGLRPRLPWASKLDIFYDQPEQVFEILELLKADEILFVKKSVANHLRDWIKVRPDAGRTLVKNWNQGSNPHTRWILKHALRKGL